MLLFLSCVFSSAMLTEPLAARLWLYCHIPLVALLMSQTAKINLYIYMHICQCPLTYLVKDLGPVCVF